MWGAAHGVVHHHLRRPADITDVGQARSQRGIVTDIAGHGERIRAYLRQRLQPIRLAGEHGDPVAARRLPSHASG